MRLDGSSPRHRLRSVASGPGTVSFGSEIALVSAPGKTASRGTRPLPVRGRVVVHCAAASTGVIPGSGRVVAVVDAVVAVARRADGSALSVVHAPSSVVAASAPAASTGRAAVAERRPGAHLTTVPRQAVGSKT